MFIVKLIVALVRKQSSMDGSYGVMLAMSLVRNHLHCHQPFPLKLVHKVLLFVSNKRARAHTMRKLRGWCGSNLESPSDHSRASMSLASLDLKNSKWCKVVSLQSRVQVSPAPSSSTKIQPNNEIVLTTISNYKPSI